MALDIILFHSIGESSPVLRIESGDLGNPLGPVDPRSDVVTKRKVNPKIQKKRMNFVFEICIIVVFSNIFQ